MGFKNIEKEGELSLVSKYDDYPIVVPLEEVNWIKIEENIKRDGSIMREYTILPMELSQYIKRHLHYLFVRSATSETTMIYVYDGGVYRWISEEQFKYYIKSFIPYQLRKSKDIEEIFRDIKTEMRFIEHDKLDTNEDIIIFEDGVWNWKTEEFTNHSPEYLCTMQVPAKYEDIKNSDGAAPVFAAYLDNLCDGNVDLMNLIMQCVGLTISNVYGYRTKKSMFLVGKGDTGKSKIKELLEKLLGNENVSSIDFKTLNERFGTSSVYQKRLVGCNDMSYQSIADMSIFKQLTRRRQYSDRI